MTSRLWLISWSLIGISIFLVVLYGFEYDGYSNIEATATPMPGTLVPNTYVITLSKNITLESFESYLKDRGIPVIERFSFVNALKITIPENKTIGDLKQIFDPNNINRYLVAQDRVPLTNLTQACELIKGDASIVIDCEPEVRGGPAGI